MNAKQINTINSLTPKALKRFILPFLAFLFLSPPLCGQPTKENRIELYGRIWGMIKYYHPTIQKDKINWDSVFTAKYNSFKEAADTSVYNQLVRSLLDTVGRVRKKRASYKHFPKDTTVCNLDFKWIDRSPLLNTQNKTLLNDIIKYYKPKKNKTIAKENTDYEFRKLNRTPVKSYPNEPISMLALFNYWSRINYCFAYKPLMDIPWDQSLKEFIPKVKSSSGCKQFYLTIAELITHINDGHGWCVNSVVGGELGTTLPFTISYVEGKTIISSINDSLSKLLGMGRGDEILESNGQSVAERRKYLDRYIGGSNKSAIELFKNFKILGVKDSGISIIKIKDTLGVEKTIAFYHDKEVKKNIKSLVGRTMADQIPYKFISEKYGYIDAGLTTIKDVRRAFRKFSTTKAIIIDNRKYGGASAYFFSMRITNKNISYANYCYMNSKFPGTYKKTVFKTNYLGIAVFHKKYHGKMIVLTDEHTGSGMELASMWYRAIGATLVGRNTGGYDGACKPFLISPDFGAAYSGDAVTYPDGTPTQRIGIVPDIYVKATYEGVKQGRDEILEKAIQYLDAKQKKKAE